MYVYCCCGSGIFYFNQSVARGTFVLQSKAGINNVTKSSTSTNYCIAPIVTSETQRKVVFWVAATDCCVLDESAESGARSWCWDRYQTPGSLQSASLLIRESSTLDMYERARMGSCNALARNNSIAEYCSLPVVYLQLEEATTEETLQATFVHGTIFACLMAFMWPCIFYIFVQILNPVLVSKLL